MKHLVFQTITSFFIRIISMMFLFSSCMKGGPLSKSVDPLKGSLNSQNSNPFKELSVEVSQDNGIPSIASSNIKKVSGDFKFVSSENVIKTVDIKIDSILKPGANANVSYTSKVVNLTNVGSPISTINGNVYSITTAKPSLIGITVTAKDSISGATLAVEANLVIQCEVPIVGEPFVFNPNGLVLTPASETPNGLSLGGYFANFSGVVVSSQLGFDDVKVLSFDKDGSWIRNNPALSVPWRDRFRTPVPYNQPAVPFYTMFGSSKQKMGVTFIDKCLNSQDVLVNIPSPHFTTDENDGLLHSVGTEIEALNEAAWHADNNTIPTIIDFLTVHDTQLNTSQPGVIVDDALSGYRQFISAGITPFVSRNIVSELIYSGSSIKVTFSEKNLANVVEDSEGFYSYVVDISGISLPTSLYEEKHFTGRPTSVYSYIPGDGDNFSKTSFTGNSNSGEIAIKMVRLVTGDCSGGQTPPAGSPPYETKSKTFLVHAVWDVNLNEVGGSPARSISSIDGKYYKLLGTEEANCPGYSGGGSTGGGGVGGQDD